MLHVEYKESIGCTIAVCGTSGKKFTYTLFTRLTHVNLFTRFGKS